MDYKYILQLLDRFWKAETTLEEEDILHIFFSQSDIPAELEEYRPYFGYARKQEREVRLDDDFSRRILDIVGEETSDESRKPRLRSRLMPLLRAVAIVAVVLSIGTVAQMPYRQSLQPLPMSQHGEAVTTAAVAADSTVADSMRQSQLIKVVKPQESDIATAEKMR